MRRQTTVVLQDDAAPTPANSPTPSRSGYVSSSPRDAYRAVLGGFTSEEIAALEDELDFYAFTGIAGPLVKRVLSAL